VKLYPEVGQEKKEKHVFAKKEKKIKWCQERKRRSRGESHLALRHVQLLLLYNIKHLKATSKVNFQQPCVSCIAGEASSWSLKKKKCSFL